MHYLVLKGFFTAAQTRMKVGSSFGAMLLAVNFVTMCVVLEQQPMDTLSRSEVDVRRVFKAADVASAKLMRHSRSSSAAGSVFVSHMGIGRYHY